MQGDAIAVVGLSCRLPQAPDPEAFWRLLAQGVDVITEHPGAGRASVMAGGHLADVDLFDAEFFDMSPREAAVVDPQQRLMLELAWEALEDAGLVMSALHGTRTSVFVGAVASDYTDLAVKAGPGAVTAHSLTGLSRSLIANRVSYRLGVRGPSVTVDTGQSSSLVALHLACQSLRSGESTLAVVGGIQLNLAEAGWLIADEFGGLSADGRCYVFDARANGYVRGEGGGAVVLKPLAEVAYHERVYCVIRGSAVNNDGGGAGLAVPNGEAQEEVLRLAYEQADVEPAEVQYVELHGTGTRVGDPIEAAALGAVLGDRRAAESPVLVGSVKTNVGHLEGAAGIVGFIKTALAMHHRIVPPSLNYETPNPAIPMDALRLRVNTALLSWQRADGPLLAGVSSFGVGGTNCHVVMASDERTPAPMPVTVPGAIGDGTVAWPVSGRTETALRAQAARLLEHLRSHLVVSPAAIGTALATARSAFESRAVVVAGDRDGLLAGVSAVAAAEAAPCVVRGRAGGLPADRVVFVFPGQGSQWPGMAVDLLESSPPFAERMRACDEAIAAVAGWSPIEILRASREPDGAALLERIELVQPVLFAVMVSLAQLWRACGVQPAAVVGCSQGEVAAACVAGALSLQDAARVVVARSRLLADEVADRGGMASVALSAVQVFERLRRWPGRLHVSGENGPRSTTIAGDSDALSEFIAGCVADGVSARVIRSAPPSHCPAVERIREPLQDILDAGCAAAVPTRIPMHSTVTGTIIDGTALDTDYWYRNLREPVAFLSTLWGLLSEGYRVFVEMSPHPVLTMGMQDAFDDAGIEAVELASLRRNAGGPAHFAASLAEAYAHGVPVDWPASLGGTFAPVTLPTYAFQRNSYWLPGLTPRRQATPDVTEAPPATAVPALVDGRTATVADDGTLRERFRGMTADAAGRAVLSFVCGHVAALSGSGALDAMQAERPFKELGFDSAMLVELRNRLRIATETSWPTSVLFDNPSPAALSGFLLERLRDADAAVLVEEAPPPAAEQPLVPAPVPAAAAFARPAGIPTGGAAAALVGAGQPPREPVAIVGMACRYPGRVRSPQDLWDLVLSELDAISELPADRGWNIDELYDPHGERPGTTYTRFGGFLDGAAEFDAAFFGISPREALAMDPQQRLLLESAWEACEHAGIDPLSLRGSRTGVFVGEMMQGYATRMPLVGGTSEGYTLTGTTASVASGRIAYTMDFEGPALTVDTACSSSLVALNLAVQALRAGDCDLALAGGVTVMATPRMFVEFSRQRGLAPDGRCKAFAAAADGTAWAEGVGMLLVERLEDAERRGHRVLALVRGSATNQDGASNGLTAPNGRAQRRVIRQALADAGLTAADVDVLEAHGTGTKLGDPVEGQAVLATYGRDRVEPLWLGSLKSNIGHSQAAAGVGGVIKMIMAMRHGTLPRTLHVDAPSPHIDWSAGAVSLLTRARPWPATDRPRRAAVSSFGISGTNAHVVLEHVPESQPAVVAPVGRPQPLVISARSNSALRESARRLIQHLGNDAGVSPTEVGRALATSRTTHQHRAVIVADDRPAMLRDLVALAEERQSATLVAGVARGRGRQVFVFPGQGSQWPEMAVDLLASSDVFAARLRECAAALSGFVDWPVLDVLQGLPGAPSLERVDVVQPALWVMMVSLAKLWSSVGVRPDAVVGHSQGEVAAATVAGALSLVDGARVVALRSRALTTLAGTGAMASIPEPSGAVRARIARMSGSIEIAAMNGPMITVVSGTPEAVAELVARCQADGVRARTISVDYASHSAHVEPIRDHLLEILRPIRPRAARVAYYSTVTGELLEDTRALDARYWYQNIRQNVRFIDAVRAVHRSGHDTFVEVSPHPVLVPGIAETFDDTVVVGTLRRKHPGYARFLTSAAELHVQGVGVDWPALFADVSTRWVDLPAYPFQRERYWLHPVGRETPNVAAAGLAEAEHPLLGAVLELADHGGLVLTGRLSLRTHPWLADHVIHDAVLLPGTAFVEFAMHAAKTAGCDQVDELILQAPVVLGPDGAVQVQVAVAQPDESGRRTLTVHARSRDDEEWTCHATGSVSMTARAATPVGLHGAWPPPGAQPEDLAMAYLRLAKSGYSYGTGFQCLRALWRDGDVSYAEVALPADQRADDFAIHPALLDAALHAVLLSVAEADQDRVLLPFSWSGLRLHAVGAKALRVRTERVGADGYRLMLADPASAPVAAVDRVTFRPAAVADLTVSRSPLRDRLFRLEWVPVAAPVDVNRPRWVALGDAATPAVGGAALYRSLAALRAAIGAAGDAPEAILVLRIARRFGSDAAAAAHEATAALLEVVQDWQADDVLAASRLVVVTQGAVAVRFGDEVADLPGAALWGLVRSAQTELPDRLILIDVDRADDEEELAKLLGAAIRSGEPQVAVRDGALLGARLVRHIGPDGRPGAALTSRWRLGVTARGSIDNVALLDVAGESPLCANEVRIAVRAVGLNFRDVMVALDMYPGEALLGAEAAGVVLAVGDAVTGIAVGDRVMGLFPAGVGASATTDYRRLCAIPEGWSFTEAAGAPVVFLTAYHALADLAQLRTGESLLVHTATGGVGLTALQLARYWGVEVFATASPPKWPTLRNQGVPDEHIASSRSLDFEEEFRAATGGRGVDVVLHSLAGEFTDASLRLLRPGGRFIEMGKTDIRDPERLAETHPGVTYRSFDLMTVPPERIAAIFATLAPLFADGTLRPLPTTTWDIRQARRALRFLSQAQHVGKMILTVPAPLDPDGTVIITGGTGVLGAQLARHLVRRHQVCHLLLASRRGMRAAGATQLRAELAKAGARATIVDCDITDEDDLAELLAKVPAEHPLTAVVHAAGVLDDRTITALTPRQLAEVMSPKIDAAWQLHKATAGLDLRAFVLFSSVAGVLGTPGQANYAAANAFLDALAQHRYAHGAAASSLAWGLWATATGMTGHLDVADIARLARTGTLPLATDEALGLFDAVLAGDHPALVAARLNLTGQAGVPPLLRNLVRVPSLAGAAAAADTPLSLVDELATLPEPEQHQRLLDLICSHAALVLGHTGAQAIDAGQPFKDLGFDSLATVELRNRIGLATGLRLPITLLFDDPTPSALATRLRTRLLQNGDAGAGDPAG